MMAGSRETARRRERPANVSCNRRFKVEPSINPYEPPRPIENERETWKKRLRRWFAAPRRRSPVVRFLRGERVIHYGVVFSISPEDPTTVVAALPLAVNDEKYVRRNLAEARRVLDEFVTVYPELAAPLAGRKLVVSMFSSYKAVSEEIRREVVSDESEAATADQ
jgi:hypothetical protein